MHNDVKEYMLTVNEEIGSFSKEINHKKIKLLDWKLFPKILIYLTAERDDKKSQWTWW